MLGQFAALGTALCWTVGSLSFEAAGRRVGPLSVNFVRLVIAFFLFVAYALIFRGTVVPRGADAETWGWLLLSGLTGFVLGDLFLFRAFVAVGARVSMLVYSSVPPVTALFEYLFLGERLTPVQWVAMALTVAGIAVVTANRAGEGTVGNRRLFVRGVAAAFLGAVGQAIGLVLSRYGAPAFDPFAATQIRTIAGMAGFAAVITARRRWSAVRASVGEFTAMRHAARGAFAGPFLGVSLGLYAAQRAGAGVAATIAATVPVILIPVSVLLFRERLTLIEVAGSLLAVGGVALLFLLPG